jgi:2-phospho-L-lactate guanylyltransferase (CobY/MobA/RfbA family)
MPARIAVQYGEGSFRRHLSTAHAAGLQAEVLSVPGVACDIDTPEDLVHFINDPARNTATWKYLNDLR